MSIAAYQNAAKRVESPRETEYRALLSVTRGLERANPDADLVGYHEALQKNLQVWLIFQADLLDGSHMPDDGLRAKLLSLSLWIEKHTRLCQGRQAEVQPMIDVNRAIMEGLAARSAARDAAPATGGVYAG